MPTETENLLLFTANYEKMASEALTKTAEKKNPKAEVRNRGTVVFPAESSSVKDDKDHFPINSESQARNALSRANQYSKSPEWYSGSLKSLVDAVARKVHSKYPGIEISDEAKKPGAKKSFDQTYSMIALAEEKSKKHNPKAEVRNRGTVVFPAESSSVKDDEDHFPINSESQARNALQRANQYSKSPEWYSGSLKSLVDAVARKVHSKYPGIEISDKSKKPGKD